MKERKLEWVKTDLGQRYLKANAQMLVFIHSDNGIWGWNRCGYTGSYSNAGIYTLQDAYKATSHCGKEKCVRYIPVGDNFIKDRVKEISSQLATYLKFL